LNIENNVSVKATIYPNPFENNFNINFNKENEYKIIIRDAIGRLIEDIQFTGTILTLHNFERYASGTYYIKTISRVNEVQYYKIVKN
jgi:hypothetical protein